MTQSVTRPAGVTFVVVLTWIVALVDLLGGAALVWLSLHISQAQVDIAASDLRVYGVTLLALGLVTAAVALGLAAGSQLSRFAVTILMLVRIAAAIYAFVTLGDLVQWQALGQSGAALVILIMLFTPRAHAYFRA